MKTILLFTDASEHRKVILKHKRDIHIYREVREDHFEWMDADGNVIKNRSFIVIRVPKKRNVDFSEYKLNRYDRMTLGFRIEDHENYVEVLLYDRFTFTWNVYEFEKFGIFKVSQRVIPDFKRHGELFPCYINPRGVWETAYDLFFGVLQLPFTLYSERKNQKEQMEQNH